MLTQGTFDEEYNPTIGLFKQNERAMSNCLPVSCAEDTYQKELTVDGEKSVLNILDTAGMLSYGVGARCDNICLGGSARARGIQGDSGSGESEMLFLFLLFLLFLFLFLFLFLLFFLLLLFLFLFLLLYKPSIGAKETGLSLCLIVPTNIRLKRLPNFMWKFKRQRRMNMCQLSCVEISVIWRICGLWKGRRQVHSQRSTPGSILTAVQRIMLIYRNRSQRL